MASRRRHRVSFWIAGILACAVVAGCARSTPPPVPTEPEAPRSLTITAQRKQSRAQQDRDKADCQNMASRQATSSATWAQIFTACMGGRGYMVE
jgi:hypothetical protein